MKKIKIKFVDFWGNFENDNIFLPILKKHYDVELSDNPDFIFCSVYGEEFYDYDAVRIFYTGENISPDYNLYDYSIDFEYIQYGDRQLRFPNYVMWHEAFDGMMKKHEVTEQEIREKKGFCSFVYSNPNANPIRSDFFYKLSDYKQVQSGGRFLNNTGDPDGVRDKLAFQTKHKFSIAFENSSHPGYTTEKLVEAFAAKTVPIYWGDPLAGQVFNENAFINVHQFQDVDEAIAYVQKVDQDDALYARMLREPALKSGQFTKEWFYQELEAFLIHIFNQDPGAAYRRNRDHWGKIYAQTRKNRRDMARKIGRVKQRMPKWLIARWR